MGNIDYNSPKYQSLINDDLEWENQRREARKKAEEEEMARLQAELAIDSSYLDEVDTEVDVSEMEADEAIENVIPEDDAEDVDIKDQIKQAKANFNSKIKSIKDKLNEYKKKIDDELDKVKKKIEGWVKKGKDWINCHKAMIKREIDKIKQKIYAMLKAAEDWVKKQLDRLKKELAKMLSKINKKWNEKVAEKAKQKEEAEKKRAEEYAKAELLLATPPMPFMMGSENQDYNGN